MALADEWRGYAPAQKQHVFLRLAAARAAMGLPAVRAPYMAGDLAVRHDPRFQVQRTHLRAIDQKLRFILDNPSTKHMIWTPPQVGKSTRVSRWGPMWWLAHRPRDRILLASYAERLAQGHGRAARDFVRAFGAEYGLLLNPEQAAASDWSLESGGGMISRGVRGGATGQTADLGLIDDPVADRMAADSDVVRAATWDWYSGTFVSRLSPEASILITMTRWHTDDLAGQLLKREGRVEDGGEWHVLHMPAVAVPEDHDRGFYADPLGREPGEPLSHPRITDGSTDALSAHWARQRSQSTLRDWGALYQGSPHDVSGGLLTESTIEDHTGRPNTAAVRAGVGVDPSGGGRDTAGIVGGIVDGRGKFWFTDDRSAVMSAGDWSREACLLAHDLDADVIFVEANYGGDQATTLVQQAWTQLMTEGRISAGALCPRIKPVHSRKNKYLRAEPVAQAVTTNRVGFLPGLKKLKTEWTLWQPGSKWSPGALDASVHLAVGLLPPLPMGSAVESAVAKRHAVSATPGTIAARRIVR